MNEKQDLSIETIGVPTGFIYRATIDKRPSYSFEKENAVRRALGLKTTIISQDKAQPTTEP